MLKPYPDLCSPVSLKSPRGSKLGKAMSNNTTYFHSTDSYIPCDSDDGKSNPEFYVNAISMGSSILMLAYDPGGSCGKYPDFGGALEENLPQDIFPYSSKWISANGFLYRTYRPTFRSYGYADASCKLDSGYRPIIACCCHTSHW